MKPCITHRTVFKNEWPLTFKIIIDPLSPVVTVWYAGLALPTFSDIYQRWYWYNWLSWWWALVCSKHVENWDKQIQEEELCDKFVIYMDYDNMHGQQNIKFSSINELGTDLRTNSDYLPRFLGAFAKFRKTNFSFMSVCPHGKNRLQIEEF